MFGIGMQELIIIAVIALLIVGPKKLPDLAKSIGRGLSEFRRAADGITEDIKDAVKEEEVPSTDDSLKDSLLMKKTNDGKTESSRNDK